MCFAVFKNIKNKKHKNDNHKNDINVQLLIAARHNELVYKQFMYMFKK